MSRYAATATHVYVIDAGDMAKIGATRTRREDWKPI